MDSERRILAQAATASKRSSAASHGTEFRSAAPVAAKHRGEYDGSRFSSQVTSLKELALSAMLGDMPGLQ
jgi:hypothetical protein